MMAIPRTPPSLADGVRGSVLVDLLRTMRVLSRGRVTVREAATELGVTSRTVYRHLHALESVGVCVESAREGREVHWRLTQRALMDWLTESSDRSPPDAD